MNIRPYRKEDAERIVTWFNDKDSFYNWCAHLYDHYPISDLDMNNLYDKKKENPGYLIFSFEEDGELVGHMTMSPHEEKRNTITFGFVINDVSKRGKGLGKRMLEIALDYAFSVLKADKVSLWVFGDNDARYCYESVGFRITYEEIYMGKPCYEMEKENGL